MAEQERKKEEAAIGEEIKKVLSHLSAVMDAEIIRELGASVREQPAAEQLAALQALRSRTASTPPRLRNRPSCLTPRRYLERIGCRCRAADGHHGG